MLQAKATEMDSAQRDAQRENVAYLNYLQETAYLEEETTICTWTGTQQHHWEMELKPGQKKIRVQMPANGAFFDKTPVLPQEMPREMPGRTGRGARATQFWPYQHKYANINIPT